MRIQPRFRLTVYAPRSVDPTETTPLTPRPGSPHAEPFIVTTVAGVAGARPYLGWSSGRQAAIDPLTKKRTVGRLTFRVLDKRIGTDNLERWVTAFIGDAKGANQLAGCRLQVEAWDGAAWQSWYTGRIESDELSGALWYELTVDDRSADLNAPVFVGRPHAAVAGYAFQQQLLPLGLLKPYSTFPLTRPVRGTVKEHHNMASLRGFAIEVHHTDADQHRNLMSEALFTLAQEGRAKGRTSLRAQVTPVSTGVMREWGTADAFSFADDSRVKRLFIGPAEGDNTAFPAIGSQVDVVLHVPPTAGASAAAPIVVNDIHPVTFIRHLAAGYYGLTQPNGTPVWTIPVHEASFAALEANGRFVPHRNIYDAASTLAKVLEQVCREHNLGYDLNAAGELELIDLSRQAAAGISGTLTDADRALERGVPTWAHTKKGALPVARVAYYLERRIAEDELPRFSSGQRAAVPSTRIAAVKRDAAVLHDDGARERFEKPKEEAIDATGLRFRGDVDELLNGRKRDVILRAHAETVVRDLQGPFSRGPAYIEVVCRALSPAAASVRPGQRWVLAFDVVPDPATNRRGGPRLGMCVSRTPDGPRVILRFLDLGENAVAVAPTLAAPVKTAGDGAHACDVLVTLNAAGAPVRVDIAITDAAVGVRPAATDARWHRAAIATSTGVQRLTSLPAKARVWIRARSEPQSANGLQIASGWVFPPGAGYVDLDALVAPSALVVTSLSAAGTSLAWTVGEPAQQVEVYVAAGGVPAQWLSSHHLGTLDAGSQTFPLGRYVPLQVGSQYTVGIRHLDGLGGYSAMTTATFVVGVAEQLAAPVNPLGYAEGGVYGLAVEAKAFPSFVEFREEVETAPNSGMFGAPATVAIEPAAAGDWTKCTRPAVYDGRRRRLSARHVRDNALSSGWSPGVVVDPWSTVPLPPFASGIVPPTATIYEQSATDLEGTFVLAGVRAVGWQLITWRDEFDAVPAWPGAWDATPLPTTTTESRDPKRVRRFRFRTIDAAGRISEAVDARLDPAFDYLTPSGAPRRDKPMDDGSYALGSSTPTGTRARADIEDSRQTLLATHFDVASQTTDHLTNGVTRRLASGAVVSPNGDVDFGASGGWLNRDATNLPRTPGGAPVGDVISRLTDAGDAGSMMRDSRFTLLATHFDTSSQTTDHLTNGVDRRLASGAVVSPSGDVDFGASGGWLNRNAGYLPRTPGGAPVGTVVSRLTDAGDAGSMMRDSRLTLLNTHFDIASQTADQIVDGATRRTMHAAYGDAFGRPIILWDPVVGQSFGADAINDGQKRARTGLGADGAVALPLPAGIGQYNSGGSIKILAKGHMAIRAKHGETILFPSGFFANPPAFIPGPPALTYEPRPRWGPAGDGTETGAFNATKPIDVILQAKNLSASRMTLDARLRQPGAGDPQRRWHNFPLNNSLTTVGASTEVTLTNAPAHDDTYIANFRLTAVVNPPTGAQIENTVRATVAADLWNYGLWNEVGTRSYVLSTKTLQKSQAFDDFIPAVMSDIDPTEKIRLRLKSIEIGEGGGSVTVHGYDGVGDLDSGVVYYTSVDTYASMTSDAHKYQEFQLLETTT